MTNELSPNKQALLKIRELRAQLAVAESRANEPIAIVSMACRFPRRSATPELFFQSLIDQTDQVSSIPEGRWDLDAFHDDDPDAPGKMYARHGVFLEDLDLMDPEFFGISPREATWVDPQQRLLMEVGWEALERAGWTPDAIGEHTGIFVGWMHNDYQNEASDSFLNLNPYIATGAAGSFLCGRLAYYLGLQGPSVAVDTACSSSLVALHLAINSLQRRDCDRALVGGVNAICSPTTNILTCKLKALSPNGHSRAFDVAADGYLRGEGCGVVTLRRLSDAEKSHDPILGIIRGSAVGHNGFSSGLTAPNPKAQERVIRQALRRAKIDPTRVAYLEAHGTGTELGDPIEMQAAAAALTSTRSGADPLLVGSVKTNIGHLEAAAGMAGLIKVLLAMQTETIPGQLHFETPNPHIPWDQIPVKVLTDATPWPRVERIAGVSAFGMSGTNAHVVIEAPTRRATPTSVPLIKPRGKERPQLITLSAKAEESILALAESYAKTLADSELTAEELSYTSNVARSHFEHRATVTAQNKSDAVEKLKTLSRAGSNDGISQGHARRVPRVAWQFTGQGSQFVGMGRGLYDSHPVFRSAIEQCEAWIQDIRSESLVDVLFADTEKINNTHWTQPSLFALQMGLAQVLQSWDLTPDVVLGHSVGQYAAACVAGVMSWQDGMQLIAERGRVIGELPSSGRMLAVFAPQQQVEEAIASSEKVSIAALNGTHVVISGDASEVEEVETDLVARGVRCKPLTTSHAFHSSLMEPSLAPFTDFANQRAFQKAKLPLVCNLTGKVLDPDETLDGDYWARHIRHAVRYHPSVEAVAEAGCEVILELGPQAVLTRMAAANWTGRVGSLISCLEKETADDVSLLKAIGQLYVQGVTPDFGKMHGDAARTPSLLPTYPFHRRRFWGPDKPRAFHAEYHTAHPLLGSKLQLAGTEGETRYESFIDTDSPSWLPDHEVLNAVVLPGAAYVEIAIELAADRGTSVVEATFEQPLRPTGRTAIQTIVRKTKNDDGTETQSLETHSSPANASQWTRNFSAKLADVDIPSSPLDLEGVRATLSETETQADFYAKMASLGLNYGPKFQTVQSLEFSKTEVLARLKTHGDERGFNIPPTLIDGALHSLGVGLLREDDGNLFLPHGIGKIRFVLPLEGDAWCHATWKETEGKLRSADVAIYTEAGEAALIIEDLKVQQVSLAAMRQMSGVGAERLLYALQWRLQRLPVSTTEKTKWLLVSSPRADSEIANDTRRQLVEKGHEAECVSAAKISETEPTQFDGIAWFLDGVADNNNESDLQSIIGFVQTLLAASRRKIPCGFQLVTSGAINTATTDLAERVDAAQTQFWGLGRVLGAEQPEFRCRLIDLPYGENESTREDVSQLTDILLTDTTDNQFAIRSGQLLVPRKQRVGTEKGEIEIAPGAILVTGGLGMLGRQVAKWLAEKGATQIVLVSRRAPDDSTRRFIESIASDDCHVTVHAADISCREDVERLFARFGEDLQTLRGVIHAAGVLDDGLIESQTWERFERVLGPKIQAAKLLHEFTRELDLQLFVLYSSAAAVLGSPGQSNYATGNAFLDGLAWQRRQLGLPATSINWGPWSEGMADDERLLKRMALQGITPLTVDAAHTAMERMLVSDVTQATVMDADWRRMRFGPNGETPAILQELVGKQKRAQRGDSALVSKLKSLRGVEQRSLLVQTIQESLQGILSTPQAPETDRPLIEMGLDSLMAVEFGTELQVMLGDGFNVGPTMLFDHPTIDAISDHVLELVLADGGMTTEAPATGEPISSSDPAMMREDIAIIGMSCRFPGANSVQEFWQNLLDGVDSVCDIPNDRWDVERFFSADREPGKMYTRQGGFLDDIGHFDAQFFNVSDQEACWIDPQHRMLLENSYRALEDAGIATHPLGDSNVGVFMGIMGQDYAFLPTLDDEDVIEGFQGAGLSHSAGVGRISYMFGFEGPSVAVDTASSSSLVALLQAVRSLQDGNCNVALAGGVNAILAPVNSLLMSKAGLLSPDGRCKSFSAAADGFGRGEGCGVVVLKRLSEAQRDGDRIMAVVRGGAVVHNGFSGGITSPSSKAQARVIDAALKDAGVAPSQVQYLEAHGTGTEFGDPMEIGAAVSIYGKGRKPDQALLVGSVKANISHLEAAGGASGLIKTVLAIHHGVIPPQIHLDEPSAHVPWKRMPVQIVRETTAWPECEERLAGVTALGLVGTNAHVVLGSPPKISPATEETGTAGQSELARSVQLLTLTARTDNALKKLAASYCDHFAGQSNNKSFSIADACFTVGIGRRHYEHRLAVVVESVQDAVTKLGTLVQPASRNGSSNGASLNGSRPYNWKTAMHGVAKSPPKSAWVFGGTCEHAQERLRELWQHEPVVRETVSALADRLTAHLKATNRPELCLQAWLDDETESGLFPAEIASYVLQACVAKLLQSWGLEPHVVMGTGVGQYLAYCVSGGLDFNDALILVFEQQRNRDAEDADWNEFETFADSFNFYPPNLPMVCTTTGEIVPVHRSLGGAFWRAFGEQHSVHKGSVQCLLRQQPEIALTIGSSPPPLATAAEEASELTLLNCWKNDLGAVRSLITTLGQLYVRGVTPCFSGLFAGESRQRLSLPTYPFQKRRYWITEISKHLKEEPTRETIQTR